MSKKEKRLFTVVCPEGYSVYLTLECWTKHILKFHNDIYDRLVDVELTIEQPDHVSIYKKQSSEDRVYWKIFGDKKLINPILKVPVEVAASAKKEGRVKSVIPVNNILERGKVIWPK